MSTSAPEDAPSTPTITLTPSHTGVTLSLPDGRAITIGSRDGWDTLLRVLERLSLPTPTDTAARQAAARSAALARLPWPPGLPVRFTPPSSSPWRETILFPPGTDAALGTVICEAADSTVLVNFGPAGQHRVPAAHLRTNARQHTAKGTWLPTLEDLGL